MNKTVDIAFSVFPLSFLILLGLLICLGFATKLSPPLGAWRRCLVATSAPTCLILSVVILIAIERLLSPQVLEMLMIDILGHYINGAAIIQQGMFVVGFVSINIWSLARKTVSIGLISTLVVVGIWTMVTMHFGLLFAIATDCVGSPAGENGCY